MEGYKVISPAEIKGNPFSLIGEDWMLITAGNIENYNTMTASWGGLGVLWHKNICTIYVRPQRYTFEFLEKNEIFTLSFFDSSYREALKFCGSKSGRDYNKAAETGLTPSATDINSVGFHESNLIIECRKIYFQDIVPENFLDESIQKNYPDSDYHRVYVGEILNIYSKE
jgi:flavin reductase (DIM6/NTAB) family NADH-FMN oxidoreductase RutF